MINIIYEDNHLLVVEKPVNVPVQADSSKDKDLLTTLKEYLKEKYKKEGNVYLGLVHRLDRPVGGVMVFAKTSKAASRLSKQIKDHSFKKTYLAVVEGKIKEKGNFIDKLLKDDKTNTTSVNPKGKEAKLNYKLLDYKDNLSLVQINLETGRSHQIRVQFSSRSHPLYADQRYNPNAQKGQIALFASKIEFTHPVTKKQLIFSLKKPNRYPFDIFKM
ncbi:MAG: RNA pseudouridine synthase [Bacilli bacterium]|nr:RNA pseudouridine synthase [Bacilli bacterium]